MKTLCCIVAAGFLISVPARAQQIYGSGSGVTNIWSSAQGSSDSYGVANGYSTSSSGSIANAGGRGTLNIGGGGTLAITTSNSVASSTGSGYVQTQTSGYAGGSVAGFAGRGR